MNNYCTDERARQPSATHNSETNSFVWFIGIVVSAIAAILVTTVASFAATTYTTYQRTKRYIVPGTERDKHPKTAGLGLFDILTLRSVRTRGGKRWGDNELAINDLKLTADGFDAFLARPVRRKTLARILTQVAAGKQTKQSKPRKSRAKKNVTGTRVLVAEDNEINALLVHVALSKAGYDVDIVGDGQTAVDRACTAGAGYAVVLMDRNELHLDEHDRAVTSSIGKWTQELRGDAKKLELARRMLDRCDPADLAEWGFDEASLWAPYEQETGTQAPKRTLNSYTFQRRVMLALKKDIDTRPHGKLVRRVKYYCDVLLRE